MRCQKVTLTLLLFFFWWNGYAQFFRAEVGEDYRMNFQKVDSPQSIELRSNPSPQLQGFPKGYPADKNFKNFRNVTLADIDNDGIEEIVTGINHNLYAFKGENLLWQIPLEGLAIYPPSIADINTDGSLEIVQVTGGQGEKGRIYVLDASGNAIAPWPIGFDDNWILTAPVLSDLNNDKTMEIIVNERDFPSGKVHILNLDGSSFNSNWPVNLNGTPAVTPSVGDVDNDGEKDIVVFSTSAQFIFDLDGNLKDGWGFDNSPFQKYSFQSPLLVNLDQDEFLEIVGASHGNVPQYYILEHDGFFAPNWPIDVPDTSWTFSTPTVVPLNGEYNIFMSKPLLKDTTGMLFSWKADGNLQSGFPIVKVGGLEGLISIADIDADDEFELVFGSQMVDENGLGFIHAYELDGTTEVPGFPLRPLGWTFMNGINIGDVNNNGKMDLVALSNTVEFISGRPDSAYLNVYELDVPYAPEKVLWSTYKGSNTREGVLLEDLALPVKNRFREDIRIQLYPNPTSEHLSIEVANTLVERNTLRVTISNTAGQPVKEWQIRDKTNHRLSIHEIPAGVYLISVRAGNQLLQTKKIIKK